MKRILNLFFLALSVNMLTAQVSLTTPGTPVVVDFTGFTGAGFESAPVAGQLDSDDWAITGMTSSTPNSLVFGGSASTVNYTSLTAITAGTGGTGFNALDQGGNPAIWIQPTANELSPGTLTLRYQNNTGATISNLDISYDLLVFNDQPRANTFNFSYSSDDVTYTPIAALDYTSTDVADPTPVAVQAIPKSTTITGLNIPNGAFVYIRWETNDVSGTGSRDEFGLDNISATIPTVSVSSINFSTVTSSIAENGGTATVTLTVSPAINCSATVSLGAGTATQGSDYTFSAPATVNFTAANPTVTLTIPIIDDAAIELPETVVLQLSNATNGAIIGNGSTHTLTITDNDATPISDLVITEIMYNDPSAGVDVLEFIEIYHNGSAPVNLAGVKLTTAVSLTFPSVTLNPGEYVVACVDTTAFNLAFSPSFTTYQWTGTLSNTGEKIVLEDALANVIDTVRYAPTSPPWPNANGNGHSMVLCDPNSDNALATNWAASTSATGILIGAGNVEMICSPNSSDGACVAPPVITFSGVSATVNENVGTYTLTLDIAPTSLNATTVDIVIGAASTATDGTDFTLGTTTVTFPANSSASQSVTVNITDDVLVEGNENIYFYLANPTNLTGAVAADTFGLVITDNDVAVNPVVSFVANSSTVDEAAGTASISLSILGANTNPTSVDVIVTGGTAGSGDYTIATATVTFPANSSAAQTFTVNITDDAISELAETVTFQLSNPTNSATFNNSNHTLTITDNDNTASLMIVGVYDAPLFGGVPKGVELYATGFIPDLSMYGIGRAVNGGGAPATQGVTLPAISLAAGTCYYTTNDSAAFHQFFGFAPDFMNGGTTLTGNGDDAYLLFYNGGIVDVFGETTVDGTGTPWDYVDGWAYRINGTGPDGSTFNINNWTFSGIDVFDNTTTNATAPIPYPNCTYSMVATPTVSFDGSSVSVNESAGIATVTVNMLTPNGNPTDVTVSLGTGTATSGSDFNYTPVTLTFPANSSTPQTVTVSIIDDSVIEIGESVVLQLTAATNGAIVNNGTYTINIVDNDAVPVTGLAVTEIMFNDPTGPDSLEFVEIYNTNANVVDLTGVTINTAVTYTFPAGATVPANGFVVVAKDTTLFNGFFAYHTSYQYTGTLNNVGEAIVVRDANGIVIDSVSYFDTWATALPDGTGPSLTFCGNPNTDDNNVASNWGASGTSQGVLPNGATVSASPGAAEANCIVGTELVENAAFSVYPNPANDFVRIEFVNATNAVVTLYNLNGSAINQSTINGNALDMNISNLPVGLYIIKVQDFNTGKVSSVKVIKD